MSRTWTTTRGERSLTPPLLMGVVNVTPDSFSDGGLFLDADSAVAQGLRLEAEGAAILDVGGESTRPQAEPVSLEIELERVVPVVEQLSQSSSLVSIDTTKGEVARACLEAGAAIVNDISAGSDPALLEAAARSKAGLVLMHMQGTPQTMQEEPTYFDVVNEVGEYLSERARTAMAAGVRKEAICLDPGIGFGKLLEHNLTLLAGLSHLAKLGFPLMVGTSRKAFLGKLTGIKDPTERDIATAASVAVLARTVDIFRVHNVAACQEALAVALAIVSPSEGERSTRD